MFHKLKKRGMESLTGNRILDIVIGIVVILGLLAIIFSKGNALFKSFFGG